jgi:hypothetical protein
MPTQIHVETPMPGLLDSRQASLWGQRVDFELTSQWTGHREEKRKYAE